MCGFPSEGLAALAKFDFVLVAYVRPGEQGGGVRNLPGGEKFRARAGRGYFNPSPDPSPEWEGRRGIHRVPLYGGTLYVSPPIGGGVGGGVGKRE